MNAMLNCSSAPRIARAALLHDVGGWQSSFAEAAQFSGAS